LNAVDPTNLESRFLGDLQPLKAFGKRMPDKRKVSLRWLSGAVLTGLTSAFLMGGALLAAMDGRQQFTLPAQAYENASDTERDTSDVTKGRRPGLSLKVDSSNSNIMMVSTISREGARDIVKVRPFLHVDTPLAIAPKSDFEYPKFDPLAIFSDSDTPEPVSKTSDLIYGAEVETEVAITMKDFDPANERVARTPRQQSSDIEEMVRRAAPGLGTGATSIASMTYLDPARFSFEDSSFLSSAGVTITAENVSVVEKVRPGNILGKRFEERIIKIRAQAPIAEILKAEGVDQAEAEILQKALSSDMGSTDAQPDDHFRMAFEVTGNEPYEEAIRPNRISVYRNANHMVSIARTDTNRFVYAPAPDPIPQISESDDARPVMSASRLPSAYDAIYRAALSEGLGPDLATKLVRVLAFDVDFKAKISPTDELSVFVSLEEGAKEPTAISEILFASIKLGSVERKYYRFRDTETGRVDYYDETGKSAKKFLMRQPVPNGKFRSPFGKRYHPILKYRKMHWGVDWAAPRGTPILAAGNGVVESAGWNSGYGKQTRIKHANGYITSYSHQTRIADGVKPGARVNQGQIIGYVGSTGLSTGPHLHYEVVVNGTKVDPMRIRLPEGKVLKDSKLAAFQSERDRIDDLLLDESETTRVAQN
jgi:murein DD-endopeptidase MepM/ murein hydrolase activator NlpD